MSSALERYIYESEEVLRQIHQSPCQLKRIPRPEFICKRDRSLVKDAESPGSEWSGDPRQLLTGQSSRDVRH